MNTNIAYHKKPKDYIKTSSLLLVVFCIIFLSRVLNVLGVPEIINFIHFALVPAVCVLALFTTRTKDRHQIAVTWTILSGLLILFSVIIVSALLNKAGVINVILDFMLLGEPFIMLITIISLPLSLTSIKRLRTWLVIFAIINFLFVFFQAYILRIDNPDFIYGIFFSNAGATVSSLFSITFGLYYLVSTNTLPIWLRVSVFFAALWQIIISDTKLVLGTFFIGFILLSLTRLSQKTLIYLIIVITLIYGFFWALQNVELLQPYAIWIKPEYFSLNNEFTRAKTKAFSMMPQYYESSWNWVFGIGPGHGIGRLGGWMMEKYWNLLQPLGATWPFPSMSVDIMDAAVRESINVLGTAMFGPLIGWAGIWGDLGFAGLGAYLLIWFLIWCNLCLNDFSRFLILATFAVGTFPAYIEEPGFMLLVTFIIGLSWHEQKEKKVI